MTERCRRGPLFTSSSGSNSRSVAEHMLACLLALCRRLPTYRDAQRDHQWKDEGAMKTIFGAAVLVVGAGHIGAEFARLCQGLGAHTVGLKRTVTGPVQGFDELDTMDQLDQWLPRADVVALSLPHTPETAGLMDEGRLRRMREDAILLNAGRGSVLDQDALARVMGGGPPVGGRPGRHRAGAPPRRQPPVGHPQPAAHPPRGRGDAAGEHPEGLYPNGPGQPAPVSGGRAPGEPGQIKIASLVCNPSPLLCV